MQIEFGSIPVSYVQSFSSRVETTETIVFGDKGTLRFDYGTLALITGDGTAEWANPHAGQGKPESTYLSLNRLLDAIEAGEQPSNSFRSHRGSRNPTMAAFTVRAARYDRFCLQQKLRRPRCRTHFAYSGMD